MTEQTQPLSMLGLFRQDVATQSAIISQGLEGIQSGSEGNIATESYVKACQYLANSAKLVQVDYVVKLANSLLKVLLSRPNLAELSTQQRDNLLQGITYLNAVAEQTDDSMSDWYDNQCVALRDYIGVMENGGEASIDGSQEKVLTSTPHKETYSMFDLFQAEMAQQQEQLTKHILALEADPNDEAVYQRLDKSLQHIKKASQFLKVHSAVQLAELMDVCLAKFAKAEIEFTPSHSETLLLATNIFDGISKVEESDLTGWLTRRDAEMQSVTKKLLAVSGDIVQPSVKTSAKNEITKIEVSDNVQEDPAEACRNIIAELNDQAGKQVEQLVVLVNQLFLDQANEENLLAARDVTSDILVAGKATDIEWIVGLSTASLSLFEHVVKSGDPISDSVLNLIGQGADYLKQFLTQFCDQIDNWYEVHLTNIQDIIDDLNESLAVSHIEVKQFDEPKPAEPSIEVVSNPEPVANSENQAEIDAVDIGSINITADDSLMELFRVEVEGQSKVLSEALLELEADSSDLTQLEVAMRSAHSVKGAARMVGIEPVVRLAHVMEDVFVAAQEGNLVLSNDQIDTMLSGLDMIIATSEVSVEDAQGLLSEHGQTIKLLVLECRHILEGKASVKSGHAVTKAEATTIENEIVAGTTEGDITEQAPASGDATQYRKVTKRAKKPKEVAAAKKNKVKDNAIRVSAQSLNRLMGLAGESLIESRWVRPFLDSMLTLKRHHVDMISALDSFRETCVGMQLGENVESLVRQIQEKAASSREEVVERISDMEDYERRATNLAARLNREVIASRMRPFADGVHGFRRMVRDVAKGLDKEINFEIHGLATQVDRDILEQIEAPLNHVLRNAIDHGIEMPDEREANGKPRQASIRLDATHASGMLSISVSDDGCGIDTENIRKKILDRELASEEMTESMTKAELLDFLFLPSFSTKDQVTEISGRGVGLDVVHSAMQEMRGSVRVTSKLGEGTKFHLQLPLTLSVVRALTVEIAGEPYAFPLARVEHTLRIPRDQVQMMEGRRYFTMGNQHIGVIKASQILGMHQNVEESDDYSLVLVGERLNRYGLIVDKFLGERALVVHALDSRLGAVKDISSASIMDDGTPVLIIDVDDMIQSIDNMVSGGRLGGPTAAVGNKSAEKNLSAGGPKRVLVVDDSITVREVERNMLEARGYDVEIAVDGADGWNAVRTNYYDLIISDIDMPRMNGFEFVGLVKSDANYAAIPVMIVSYKDREEDRIRGMDAGADYYLTKGSFQDDTLIDAVFDLIGEA